MHNVEVAVTQVSQDLDLPLRGGSTHTIGSTHARTHTHMQSAHLPLPARRQLATHMQISTHSHTCRSAHAPAGAHSSLAQARQLSLLAVEQPGHIAGVLQVRACGRLRAACWLLAAGWMQAKLTAPGCNACCTFVTSPSPLLTAAHTPCAFNPAL